MPRLIYYLVPVFSSILFVITQAFHIFYSDQTELISVMSESKRIFDEEYHVKNVLHKEMFLTYNAKCFPQGNVFL